MGAGGRRRRSPQSTESVCVASADGSCQNNVGNMPELNFQIDVFREKPLLALVRGFASTQECTELMRAGGEESAMDRAYVETNNKAGASNAHVRRSYTASIQADLSDKSGLVPR